jgi:hypothetical protein
MYGELQAVTGRSLIAIPTLEAALDMPAGGDLPAALTLQLRFAF